MATTVEPARPETVVEAARFSGGCGMTFSPRVLHVIPSVSPKRGGPSEAIFPMVRALRSIGIQAEIATTNDDAEGVKKVVLGCQAMEQSVPIRYFGRFSPPFRALREYAIAMGFCSWLENHLRDYDLIHVHALFSYVSSLAMAGARRQKIPYVSRPLGQLGLWPLRQSAWRKKIYYSCLEARNLRRAAALHFTSRSEEEEAAGLALATRTAIIPHGITLSPPLLQAGERLRAEMGLPSNEKIILFLGRLHPKKGLDLLLPAFAALQNPCATLILAGDGTSAFMDELSGLVRRHRLASKVRQVGFVAGERKQLFLQGSDFLALPSRHENFGVVVLEALAAGIPVLVSDRVALAPQVKSAGLGQVTPLEPDAIRQAMERLLGDRSYRAEELRSFVAQNYSWEANAASLAGLYASILRTPP
jgi:glycosyltransferase involved in cell wall biosynthesis